MKINSAISLGRLATQRVLRLYHKADIPTLPVRLKFRGLRRTFYRELWEEAARNIGASSTPWRNGYEMIRRGDQATIVYLTQTNLNPILLHHVLMDKAATEELLSERGYPTPPNVLITKSNIDDAVRFFEAQDRCVVVKPASGTAGGRGVTTHITKMETLRDALRKAARYADTILVEKHIIGGSYRLLYIGGHYIDAVRRDPATVIGDGRSSIKQLIKKENQRRLRGKPISALLAIRINQDCTSTLSRQGLTTSSVPAVGEEVQIKTAINDNSAAQNHNVRDDVHPDVIAMGERIMADLGIPLGGIDIQTSDITRPLSQTGGAVIEINSPPGIHHHYLLADRQKVTPVAEHILEHIFTTGEGALRGQTRPARTENSGAAPKHAGSDCDEQKTIKVNANAS